MTCTVTFKIQGNSKELKKATLTVESKKLISTFCPDIDMKNMTVTETQFAKMQEAGRRAGDLGVLERCDLNPDEMLTLAKFSGYDKYYDISLSYDSNEKKYYFLVKVKKTNWPTADINAGMIKTDFNLKTGVLMKNNEELIKNKPHGRTADDRNTDYDTTTFEPNEVIKIPVGEVKIRPNGPKGGCSKIDLIPFWTKLCKY